MLRHTSHCEFCIIHSLLCSLALMGGTAALARRISSQLPVQLAFPHDVSSHGQAIVAEMGTRSVTKAAKCFPNHPIDSPRRIPNLIPAGSFLYILPSVGLYINLGSIAELRIKEYDAPKSRRCNPG